MKTKVLVVPTLIVVSGFLAINYLKPDFDTYLEKRATRDAAKAHAEQAEMLANNVRSLRAEIDTQKPKIDFLNRYLPADKEQGRTFDNINFLTTQAGLITSKIQITDVQSEESSTASQTFGTLDPVADADPLAIVEDPGSALVPTAPPYQPPKVRKYSMAVEAVGGYQNIKDVLQKFTTLDRHQEVESFKIAATEGAEGGGGTLTLAYTTLFPYQAKPDLLSGEAIVNIPGLLSPSFDLAVIESIQAGASSAPDIVLGTEGKSNPFE